MKRLLPLLLIVLLFGCSKDTDDPKPAEQPDPEPSGRQVLLLNEGGFTYGNASVGRYSYADGGVEEAVFQRVNERPLGDVLQSGIRIKDRLFFVLNNSNRIEVAAAESLELLGSVIGLTSPRFLLPLSDDKAYVTDFQANAIAILNLQTLDITGAITVDGWTEELQLVNGKVFVCNRSGTQLFVIDPATDAIVSRISVGYGAGAMEVDANGKLWVYCVGDETQNLPGGLYRVDPVTETVEKTFPLDGDAGLFPRLAMNPAKDSLFFLSRGLIAMSVTATTLPEQAFIATSGKNIYALGIDPENGHLFLGDARDYLQKGEVLHYNRAGTLLDKIPAGVIPNGFLFE